MSWADTFSPALSSGTVSIAMATTSANVALGSVVSQVIRVYNDATVTGFIAFGSSTITALSTAGAMPVGAGVTEVFRPNGTAVYGAASVASGSGNMYFTPGSGN